MNKKPEGHIEPYTHPAAGWGALKQVAINLVRERVAGGNFKTLLKQNQPDGFDCPGCAWPTDFKRQEGSIQKKSY